MNWIGVLVQLVLFQSALGLFEWVHPEKWQPTEPSTSMGEKMQELKDDVKERAQHATEAIKDAGSSVAHQAKEMGSGLNEGFRNIRKKSREEVYEPMVRMMKHALNILDEEEDYHHSKGSFPPRGWPSAFESNPHLWREYPDEYLLFVDVPGIPRPDLHVNVTRNHLIISGHHGACIRPAKAATGEDRFCLERTVLEQVRLPEDIHQARMECRFKDGVLIVKMPKTGLEGKTLNVLEYVPTWSERAKEAKDAVLEKIGVRHSHPHQQEQQPY